MKTTSRLTLGRELLKLVLAGLFLLASRPKYTNMYLLGGVRPKKEADNAA